MAEAPIWPVATDAFIADTTHLDAEQTGAYMMLLMSLWRSPDAKLPLDDKKLCRMARVSQRRWPAVWGVIADFFTIKDGFIAQNRVTSDRVDVRERVRANRENGAKGGKAKALKTNKLGLADANISPSSEPSENLPIHIHIHKPVDSPPISPPIEIEFAEFWKAYPRHIAKPRALKAFKAARKRVSLEDMLAGLERYKASKPDYADWCHASTWLNEDRWADDYGPKRDGPAQVDWDAVAARHGVN